MEDEINFLDYWRMLLRWKWSIAALVFLISSVSVIYSLRLPNIYKATATLMPIGGAKGSGLSILREQVGLSGVLGGVSSGTTSPVLTILKSTTLAESMIVKHQLWGVLYKDLWNKETNAWRTDDLKGQPAMEDAVRDLTSIVTFNEDKKAQLIEVSALSKDPQIATDLVNNYIKELSLYLTEGAFTSAKRNRFFIEEQLERNKSELLESGRELNNFYSANKISNVVPTVDVDVTVSENSQSNNETTPLQKKADDIRTKIEQAKIVRDVPQQVYLQYLTLRRDILGQINSLLTQQYEMAKIDESKEDLNFQVIDWARVPVRKFKPQRSKIVMTAFVMSIFLGVFYAFFREYISGLANKKKEVETANTIVSGR